MGINADKSQIQIKILNDAKGPAIRALRAQADKVDYPKNMQETLKNTRNLEIKEAMVEDLIVDNNKIKGVVLENGEQILSKAVILTTGTYLKASIMVGSTRTSSGPHGERRSNYLSDNLRKLGFKVIRLKTGTPQRIAKESIDFSKTKIELGSQKNIYFSFDNHIPYSIEDQIPCHLIYTNSKTHQIIRDNLHKASMYGGLNDVEGIGPRYCPSIEDKIVRFSDKERHQLFLEPESQYNNSIYLQGFSTSMPHDVQDLMVHSLEGLENAKILKYAYAIEYDAIYPTQLKKSLETKLIENLFTAGQINGTSGYEEAAGQGLIAGMNAALKLEGKEPLILKRNEAYIGVLIDDLINKGVRDPYRLLTSRAEFRLLLRSDNADLRLRDYGHDVGLIDEERYQRFLDKKKKIEELNFKLQNFRITPTIEVNSYLESIGSAILKDGISLYDLLKRSEINIDNVKHFIDIDYGDEIIEQVVINTKYDGYIKKEEKEALKMLKLESKEIPLNIDYNKIKNIASEARQKLNEVRPTTIGQAGRISGVNPADIAVLSVYLKKEYNND